MLDSATATATQTTDPEIGPPPDGWILASDAAAILGCSAKTVIRRLLSGNLTGGLCTSPTGLAYYVAPTSDARLAAVYTPGASLVAGQRDAADGHASDEWMRLSESERRRAADRAAAIKSWTEYRDSLGGAASVQIAYRLWAVDYAVRTTRQPTPIAWSTMWHWLRTLRAAGGNIAALASSGWGGGKACEPDDAAWAFFCSLYLTTGGRTAADCHRQTAEAAHKNRWRWISYAAAVSKVERDIPKPLLVRAREGAKALNDKCLPYVERDYDSIQPNDWWVADHHQIDVAVIGPKGTPEFPWLTAWMDCKSRRIVGWFLSFGPNSDTAMAALARAMGENGVPRNLYMDNGRDFRARTFSGGKKKLRLELDESGVRASLSFLRSADNLGVLQPVAIHFAQPYNAQTKHIERFFRTLGCQFSRQWGTYRGSSAYARPEGLDKLLRNYATNCLVPSFEEFEAAFTLWIEQDYNDAIHRGRGMHQRSPHEVYFAERPSVTRVHDRDLALLMMRASEPRVVGRNGISLFDRSYHAPELFPLLGQRVYVRYDTRNIGRVYIFTMANEFVCTAERKELIAWGATQEDLRDAHRAKAQYRKTMANLADMAEQANGGVEAVARRKRRTESERTGRPTPPPPGDPIAEIGQEHIFAFRSAYADAAAALAGRKAVGSEGAAVDAGRTLRIGPDTVDRQTGEVLGDSPSTADLAAALERSLGPKT